MSQWKKPKIPLVTSQKVFEKKERMFQCASHWSKPSFAQQSPTACVIHNILTSNIWKRKPLLISLLSTSLGTKARHACIYFTVHSRKVLPPCRTVNETCSVFITAAVCSNPCLKCSFVESQLFSQGLCNERQKSHGERCQW